MKIVFTGGGTAGHIFPLIAVIRELKKQNQDEKLELFYLGPKDEYGATLLKSEGVIIKKIWSGKVRRYFSFKNFADLFKIPFGFLQAFCWLFFNGPNLVFSKGGYGSFPTALAAELLGIPVFLHESDSVPGLASRIEAKWALEIFTSFPETERFAKEKMICVGNPVREAISQGDSQTAKSMFNLQADKPIILILGGSQGSQRINNVILEILLELLEDFEIIHQTGFKNYQTVKAESQALSNEEQRKYYHPIAFLNEEQLKHALAASELIVSRAGGGAIFEIAASQKPALLIPLKGSAQNHQVENSYRFAESGGGEVIEEDNLKPHFFLERLRYFFSREDILSKMREASGEFARPRAARIIASYVLTYLKP